MARSLTNEVTLAPTARLARQLMHDHAVMRSQAGELAWVTPDILNFRAWLARLKADYFLTQDDGRVPVSDQQAELLWRAQIDADIYAGAPKLVRLVMQSWARLHDFQIPHPRRWSATALSEDNASFRRWALSYERELADRGWADDASFFAEIPALIEAGLIAMPKRIHLPGFDLPLTPLQEHILDAAGAQGTELIRESRHVDPGEVISEVLQPLTGWRFADERAELLGAVQWARNTLLDSASQDAVSQPVAIVVPDLAGKVDQVEALFRQVFDERGSVFLDSSRDRGAVDGDASSQSAASALPVFHISLGKPLASWPLIADALLLLGLDGAEILQPQLHELLHCPFIAGWSDEQGQRSLVMADVLNLSAPYRLTWSEVWHALGQRNAGEMVSRLRQWQAARTAEDTPKSFSGWAQRFSAELVLLGYGHGRALDSRERQLWQRWQEMLDQFAQLDVVSEQGRGAIKRHEALTLLQTQAQQAVFRERNRGAAIEVLGVEEALGSRFAAVWITGLDQNRWPGAPQRDPLLPMIYQGVLPRASVNTAYERSAAELALLRACSDTVCGSYVQPPSEPAALTPLLSLGDFRSAETQRSGVSDSDEAIVLGLRPVRQLPMEVIVEDELAPPIAHVRASGGTGVLFQQSHCPFRAFSERRLGARDLRMAQPGLDPATRGSLVHKVCELFWREVGDHAGLMALSEAKQQQLLDELIRQAMDEANQRFMLTLTGREKQLQHVVLTQLLTRWLALERTREPFTVEAVEVPVELDFSWLKLNGKIDRIDRLSDGRIVLLDYKTSMSRKSAWLPEERIDDPQLPAYTMALPEPPSAIAFARLRADGHAFDGLTEDDAGIPGVVTLNRARNYPEAMDWPELTEGWKLHVLKLADDYCGGVATVAPRQPLDCARCHLHGVCRIHERSADSAQDEADTDEDVDYGSAS